MKTRSPLAAFAVGLLVLAGPALAQAPAQDGAGKFADICSGCHYEGSDDSPPLGGVTKRQIAGLPGYAYSPALKAKTGAWTDANLDALITDSQVFAPGTPMMVQVSDPATRAAIIAYLKTLP